MSSAVARKLEPYLARMDFLIVDDNSYTRTLLRGALKHMGVRNVYESPDAISGLSMIEINTPSIAFIDWEMPLITGAEMVRAIRSPGRFSLPDIPIIMMSGHGERWRVEEAMKLGVNEFVLKPISGKTLVERIAAIVLNPRPVMQIGDYYGPKQRVQTIAMADYPRAPIRRKPQTNVSTPAAKSQYGSIEMAW